MANNDSVLSCGRMMGCVDDVRAASASAHEMNFDFISCCISHPRCTLDTHELPSGLPTIQRADLEMTTNEWSRHIVGEMTSWVDADAEDEKHRSLSVNELKEGLDYANYLSLTVYLIPVKSGRFLNLCRIINSFLQKSPYTSIWLNIPASLPSQSPDNGHEVQAPEDPWNWWNTIRSMCDNHKKLCLALDIPADLPEANIARRWFGEPIRCITVDTGIFLTNKNGRPVLSRAHQRFIHGFYKLDCQVLLTGDSAIDGRSIKDYKTYLDWLWQQQPPPDNYTSFAKGYEDYLQIPLQPLSDHLESQIYETFERDPVKYSEYERAIEKALADKKAENAEDFVVTVMVLGAGRGPLVTATLRAATKTQSKVKVYAVEKNPSAVITLNHLLRTTWSGSDVDVIHSDMRDWNPESKADIVVSELLGSFGDNELSPECLDGAQRLMKGDAVSIPSSYTSYIVPIQSERLWTQVKDHVTKSGTREEAFDVAYVVRVHNRHELGSPQPLFTFTHPNSELNENSNDRFSSLSFEVTENSVIHGFAGFFEAVLYRDVMISTVPQTHSPGMFSWFPILFPLREPIAARQGDKIGLEFWRLHNKTQVWYEWCLSSPAPTPIQNTNGAVYKMMLF